MSKEIKWMLVWIHDASLCSVWVLVEIIWFTISIPSKTYPEKKYSVFFEIKQLSSGFQQTCGTWSSFWLPTKLSAAIIRIAWPRWCQWKETIFNKSRSRSCYFHGSDPNSSQNFAIVARFSTTNGSCWPPTAALHYLQVKITPSIYPAAVCQQYLLSCFILSRDSRLVGNFQFTMVRFIWIMLV